METTDKFNLRQARGPNLLVLVEAKKKTFKPITEKNDLTGDMYGVWLVLRHVGRIAKGTGTQNAWEIRCTKCDYIRVIGHGSLKAIKAKSSICKHRTVPSVGQKYGRLTVIEWINQDNVDPKKWRCLCDCETIVDMRATQLTSSNTRSCGCLAREMSIGNLGKAHANAIQPAGFVNQRALLKRYQNNAKKRKKSWLLTDDEALALFKDDCHYCGKSPYISVDRAKTGEIFFNGIDRKNSDIGYERGNVVTACKHCNYIKNSMAYNDFISWIFCIHDHLMEKEMHLKVA